MRQFVASSSGMDTEWKTEDLGHRVAGIQHWKASWRESELDGPMGFQKPVNRILRTLWERDKGKRFKVRDLCL